MTNASDFAEGAGPFLEWSARDGGARLLVRGANGELLHDGPVETESLDAALLGLLDVRPELDPPPPVSLPRGTPIRGAMDPLWRVDLDPSGNSILYYRHPALGWTAIVLPPESAAPLASALTGHEEKRRAMAASARGDALPDCLSCGACCSFGELPELSPSDWTPAFVLLPPPVPAADHERSGWTSWAGFPASLYATGFVGRLVSLTTTESGRRLMARAEDGSPFGRCAAFCGVVGEACGCSVHASRPAACRRLERGGIACRVALERAGWRIG